MFATFRNTAISAALGLCAGLALPAQAAYVATLQEVGSNVVATGSGSIDLAGLTLFEGAAPAGGAFIRPTDASLNLGPTFGGEIDIYRLISGPTTSFSTTALTSADSGSGPRAFVAGGAHALGVPVGYASGASLTTTTDTWNSATFATLGVTPGTYVWTWGSGADADSFTLEIGAVPEPESLPLLGVGLAGLGMAVVRRRRA